MTRRRPRGQAAVELVALLPLLALAGLFTWWLIATGHLLTVTVAGARAGARAAEVGIPPADGVRAAMPRALARRVEVTAPAAARVRVVVAVPRPAGIPVRAEIQAEAGSGAQPARLVR